MTQIDDAQIVSLGKASIADIPTLLKLEESVADLHTYSAALDVEDWIEEFENNEVYLIKVGEEIIGNTSFGHKGDGHVYLSGLVIAPGFQGRGFARQALTQVLSMSASAKRIDLVTHPHNPALGLYESLGFKVESRVEDYYGDGQPRLFLALLK